jgi:flagellar biosynthesis protein FlhG
MVRVITVTSGAAGVGKTSICMHLAAQLARRGRRVCLLDADCGETNASLSLGLEPRHTLEDLILYGAALGDVLIRNCHGFDIVPGSASVDWIDELTAEQIQRLAACLSQLNDYDFLLIDSATSTARNALSFAQTSPEVVLVITPAPISLPDAYSLLKLLSAEHPGKRIHVIVNKSTNQIIGRYSYGSFREVAQFYLGMQLALLGVVGEDPDMQAALQRQQTRVNGDAQTTAARNIGSLADQLLADNVARPEADMQSFCNRFLQSVETDDAGQMSAAYVLEIPVSRKQKLRQQLKSLSSQVDDLIKEIERLRQAPEVRQRAVHKPVTETSIAALADDSEAVTLQGETFSIYSTQSSNGGRQYYAWHSPDDSTESSEAVNVTLNEYLGLKR